MAAPVGLICDLVARPFFSGKRNENFVCVIDTSTLIYLDNLDLLQRVISVFSPATIDRVIDEFGRHPEGLAILDTGDGSTDFLLVQQAAICRAVVFSEDKKVLLAAGRHGLEYYNTLMIVLALYAREEISRNRCGSSLAELKSFARYGENVWACGRQLWEELCRKNN